MSEHSLSYEVEIKEKFAFRVLDECGGHLASGMAAQLVSGRLIAQVSEYLRPNTCVRIDSDEALLLGEIQGCWCEGRKNFAAIELLQSLAGMGDLGGLREEYGDYPDL
jgi:hypothetical protein